MLLKWGIKNLFFQKSRADAGPSASNSLTDTITKRLQGFPYPGQGLYEDESGASLTAANTFSIAAKLGLRMPNLAPDVEVEAPEVQPAAPRAPAVAPGPAENPGPAEPKKKKYAKEAWPGKKPSHSLFGWSVELHNTVFYFYFGGQLLDRNPEVFVVEQCGSSERLRAVCGTAGQAL